MKIKIDTEDFPQMEGGISPEDYVELWRLARVRSGGELFGLLSFGEMIGGADNPLHEFTRTCAAWLEITRDQMAKEIESSEPPSGHDEVVH